LGDHARQFVFSIDTKMADRGPFLFPVFVKRPFCFQILC